MFHMVFHFSHHKIYAEMLNTLEHEIDAMHMNEILLYLSFPNRFNHFFLNLYNKPTQNIAFYDVISYSFNIEASKTNFKTSKFKTVIMNMIEK